MDIAGFQLWLAQKGRKASTIRLASYTITRVLRNMDKLQVSAPSYLFSLKEKGLRHSTLNNIVNALRLWGQFTDTKEYQNIPFFPEQEFVKATMSDKEIEEFLALPCPTCRVILHEKEMKRKTDPKGWYMFKVFWTICAYTGMRMGEVANLEVNDLDFGRNIIIIRDGKTGPRNVPMASNIINILKDYLKTIETKQLFKSRRKGRDVFRSTDWNYNFKKRIQILGIKRTNLTPYSLRHSFCTSLLEEDVAFPKVMKIMGHHNARTTLAYTHLTTKDICEAVNKLPAVRKHTSPFKILKSIGEYIRNLSLVNDKRFTYDYSQTDNSIAFTIKINPLKG